LEDNIKMELHEVGCGGTDWFKFKDKDRWQAVGNEVWVP
jgi:hypothetical protein